MLRLALAHALALILAPPSTGTKGMGELALVSTSTGAGSSSVSGRTPKTSSDSKVVHRAHDKGSSLQELIKEALLHNQQVGVSRAQIEQAKALAQFAEAQAYPRFDAQLLAGGPVPEAKTTVVNDLSTTTPASIQGDFDFGHFGVALRTSVTGVQPLYTFGKLELGRRATSQVVAAAEQQLRATQSEVAMYVIQAFWTVQLTRAFRRALDDGERTLRKVLHRVEELLDADSAQVTENDRMRLMYALATLGVRRAEAEGATDQAHTAMLLLLGRDQSGTVEIREVDLGESVPSHPPLIEAVVESVHQQRPELVALRKIVKAQEAFAQLRRAQFWPDVFLAGAINYAYTSNATDQTNPFLYDPYNTLDMGVALGVRIELDVFTKLALLAQAEAEREVRRNQAALAEQAAELEARILHRSIRSAAEKLKSLALSNRTARGWLTTSALAYDIGIGDARELIDSFLAWAASEAELQKTRFDTVLDYSRLAKAMGELTADGSDD